MLEKFSAALFVEIKRGGGVNAGTLNPGRDSNPALAPDNDDRRSAEPLARTADTLTLPAPAFVPITIGARTYSSLTLVIRKPPRITKSPPSNLEKRPLSNCGE
jgi:hypothetical protein